MIWYNWEPCMYILESLFHPSRFANTIYLLLVMFFTRLGCFQWISGWFVISVMEHDLCSLVILYSRLLRWIFGVQCGYVCFNGLCNCSCTTVTKICLLFYYKWLSSITVLRNFTVFITVFGFWELDSSLFSVGLFLLTC